ncbi:MAG TPA: GlsB/YeaQ/YmgE family stress response membrane protein [Sphingomicrobium sp.]
MFGGHTNWLVIAILGLLAGALAKLLTPGRDPGGCIVTILLGIAGAFLGTWLGRLVHLYGPDDKAGFIGAVVGAIIILVVYRLILGRRRRY